MEATELVQITWNDSYNVGYPRFDVAHAYLFDLANQALLAMHEKQDAESVAMALFCLHDQARQHFADEESVLKRIEYADLLKHCDEHQMQLRLLVRFISRYRKEPLEVQTAGKFLHDWVVEHVRYSDRPFVSYLLEEESMARAISV